MAIDNNEVKMDKTYKCPCCGSEIKLLIEKGFDRVKKRRIKMTLEDFAHRCLMIKAGNATLDIPCCANCKYYNKNFTYQTNSISAGVQALASLAFGFSLDGTKDEVYYCEHPVQESDDRFVASWLKMKPEDFCSRWESRNEEKEVKEKNKKTRKRKSNNC